MSVIASSSGWTLECHDGYLNVTGYQERALWTLNGAGYQEWAPWTLELARIGPPLASAIVEYRGASPGQWRWKGESGRLTIAVTPEEALAIRNGTSPLDVLLPPMALVARALTGRELAAR